MLAVMLTACASGGEQRARGSAPEVVDAAEAKRLGEAAYAAGNWREAEPHYLTLVRQIPQESGLWFRLANIYARTDRPDAAIAAYRESLVREANNGKAWFNMGVVQLRQAANSFRKLGVHVDGSDPMAVQGEQAYQAIMAILGVNEGAPKSVAVKPAPMAPAAEGAEADAGSAAANGESEAATTASPAEAPGDTTEPAAVGESGEAQGT